MSPRQTGRNPGWTATADAACLPSSDAFVRATSSTGNSPCSRTTPSAAQPARPCSTASYSKRRDTLADPFLKKHRNGALVVIGALVLVIGFWIDQAPRFRFYRVYRMKQRLRSLSLPPQSQLSNFNDFGTVEVPSL